MLDIRFVRENLDLVNKSMADRKFAWDADRITSLDAQRRAALVEEETLLAKRNASSKEIGSLMAAGEKQKAEEAKEQVKLINEKIAMTSEVRSKIEDELNVILRGVPNILSETTPFGES